MQFMTQNNYTRTKPSLFPASALLKLKASTVQFFGLLLCIFALIVFVSLVSYNTSDPSLNTASSNPPKNLVGFFGSLWDYFGILLASLWDHVWVTLGSPGVRFGIALG